MGTRRITLRYAERDHVVDVRQDTDTAAEAVVDGETLHLLRDGASVRVDGDAGGPAWAVADGTCRWVYSDGCVYELEVQEEGRRRTTPAQGSLAAPMPATVRQIRAAPGDHVARGDTLLILEAMKMELPIRADADGIVVAVHCQEGELVQPGRPLIEVGPADGA
ncbi:MAG: biotin/lipoyl-containing protein [Vicinamibacterales bacterium]